MTDDVMARVGGRDVVEQLRSSGALDGLFERIDSGEVEITGTDGLLPALLKEALERGLAAELTDHLGYERGESAPSARPNTRNGTTAKTVDSPGRQLSGRPPGQPHAHDLGLTTRRRGPLARPAAGGGTIPCSYEVPPPRWRVDPRAKSPRG